MTRLRRRSDDQQHTASSRPPTSDENTVRVRIQGGAYPGLSRPRVARAGRAMLCALQLDKSELSILLTDDDQIQRLNKLYRNIDRPTDVLSFSQRRGDFPNPPSLLLGDVVISVPTARRQATDRGLDVASEVNRLLAHGLLHLMGWDHDTPAKHQRMRRETERLCAEAATNTKGAGRAHVNRETDGATNGQSRRRTRKR